jgi:hypothetical protein
MVIEMNNILTVKDVEDMVINTVKPVWKWTHPIRSYKERQDYIHRMYYLMFLHKLVLDEG